MSLLNQGQDKSDEEIDREIIALFGVIAWSSLYQERDGFLDSTKVLQWSGGHLENEEAAQVLLNKGKDVGIFSDSFTWRDKLVADGCAVLYLGSQRGELKTVTVAQMVQKLVDTDALSILGLALDVRVLTDIIIAVARSKPTLHSIIHELANDEYILRVKRDPLLLQTFANRLFDQGCNTDAEHIAPIALTLAKIKGHYKKLDDHYSNMIQGPEEQARLALATLAAVNLDNPNYFTEIDQEGGDAMLAAAMTAWVWTERGAHALYERLVQLYDPERSSQSEDPICKIWFDWCSWQEKETVLSITKQILIEGPLGNKHISLDARLIDIALRACILNNRRVAEDVIRNFEAAVIHYMKTGKNMLANMLVKWVAYYYAPALVSTDVDWIIDNECGFAIPHQANLAAEVGDILYVKLKAASRFTLPSRMELESLPVVAIHNPELVRDNLPIPLPEDRRISPTSLVTWDGRRPDFIRSTQFGKPIAWRPRFELHV